MFERARIVALELVFQPGELVLGQGRREGRPALLRKLKTLLGEPAGAGEVAAAVRQQGCVEHQARAALVVRVPVEQGRHLRVQQVLARSVAHDIGQGLQLLQQVEAPLRIQISEQDHCTPQPAHRGGVRKALLRVLTRLLEAVDGQRGLAG